MTKKPDHIAALLKEVDNKGVSLNRDGLRRRALRSSYWEGSLYSLMIATVEHFALIFAVSRNLSTAEIGLLTTGPLLLGAIANLFIPGQVRQRSLKGWLILFVSIQSLGALGLFWVSMSTPARIFEWIFVCLTCYWLGGLVASPLWIDWMSGWLPQERLGRFFSRRTSWISLTTLFCTLVAAWTSEFLTSGPLFFALMFAVGFAARICALGFLATRPSPPRQRQNYLADKVSWAQMLAALQSSVGVPALLIIASTIALRFVANIASPYFLPYMMRDLSFSTSTLIIIQSLTYVSTFLFMSSYAESIRKYSLTTATQVAFYGIALSSTGWLFFVSPAALGIVQFFNGIFWSGLDLCLILWIQQVIPNAARRLMGIYVALCQIAAVLGSLLGAQLIDGAHLTSSELIEVSIGLRWIVAIALTLIVSARLSQETSFDQSSRFLLRLFIPKLFRF